MFETFLNIRMRDEIQVRFREREIASGICGVNSMRDIKHEKCRGYQRKGISLFALEFKEENDGVQFYSCCVPRREKEERILLL